MAGQLERPACAAQHKAQGWVQERHTGRNDHFITTAATAPAAASAITCYDWQTYQLHIVHAVHAFRMCRVVTAHSSSRSAALAAPVAPLQTSHCFCEGKCFCQRMALSQLLLAPCQTPRTWLLCWCHQVQALAGTCLPQELLPPPGPGCQLALLLSLMSLALLFQHRQQQVGCHAGGQCWQQACLGGSAGRQQGQQAAEHVN
jgi:hypothetical protein